MVANYYHEIAKWMDGTESLSDGEYRAYHVLVQLIYLNNGPIVLHESGIAGRCNQHMLAFRRNFQKLVQMGKIAVVDGKVVNQKAEEVLGRVLKTPRQPTPDPRPTTAKPAPGVTGVRGGSAGGGGSKPLKGLEPDLLGAPPESTRGKEKKEPAPTGAGRARDSKRSKIPDDWKLDDDGRCYALEHGFDTRAAVALGGAFRDFHRSRGNTMADWAAAWRTWVRNEVKFNGRRNGNGAHGGSGPTPPRPLNAFATMAAQSLMNRRDDE